MVNYRLETIEQKQSFLNSERELLNNYATNLTIILNDMENNLKNLVGIEYHLFYLIVVKGINITKAVDKVAFKYDKDVSTIWKNYYPQVKAKINKLKNKEFDS